MGILKRLILVVFARKETVELGIEFIKAAKDGKINKEEQEKLKDKGIDNILGILKDNL